MSTSSDDTGQQRRPPALPPQAMARPLLLYLVVILFFILFQVGLIASGLDVRVGTIATQVFIILGLALVYRKHFSQPDTIWPSFKRLGMSPLALIVVMTASVSIGFLGIALNGMTLQLFPGLESLAESYQEGLQDLLLPESLILQILGIIGVAVAAPICEEVLFRGTLLPEQRRVQMAAGAIVLNGALFGAIHFNPIGFISLSLIGAYWAHVTLRSGSIWGAILGHSALNLVNGVLLIRLFSDLEFTGVDEVSWLSIIGGLIVFLPLAIGLWWLSIRLIKGSR
jgi:uncharacterized protein